ncbi:MAG: type II toxin-antitoxin system tRNA(fMet)-specific endonuclease VapC [Terracidiphilus sp.]
MNYLLDTNICIALINGTSQKVRIESMKAIRAGSSLATSSIVVHELWYGVAKSKLAAQNARALSAFLGRDIAVLDYAAQDAQAAGEIRAQLERQGKRIGEYDTLIAGQAFARNLILVTANTREFRRVKGLRVEDWTV